MRRRGATLAFLSEEFRVAHPDGLSYSWFRQHSGALQDRVRPPMRQSHAVGEKVLSVSPRAYAGSNSSTGPTGFDETDFRHENGAAGRDR